METILQTFAFAHRQEIQRALDRSFSLYSLQHQYPALSEEELGIELYLRDIEFPPKPAAKPRRELFSMTGRKMCKAAAPAAPTACYIETLKCADVEEAVADNFAEYEAYEEEVDYEREREQIMNEIRKRIERLRELGIDELVLRKLFEREDTLSRLVITRDYRILLPDYHNMEIEMSPLPKAVFLLYLRHEEGIMFKYLPDYENELREIYLQLTDRVQSQVIEKSIHAICDPTQNAINEKCARIREAFVSKFNEHLALNYFITGVRGSAKRIRLKRELVVWEE